MTQNTPSTIVVPDNIWSVCSDTHRALKVVLSGTDSNKLPYDIFIKALRDNGIFHDDDNCDVDVLIPGTKRKRFLFGNLNFHHKQSFEIEYKGNVIQFLLIDPNDSRIDITLLHMPMRTTPEAIEYIFRAINDKWKVSDIRHSPGKEHRLDRWQLLLQCEDRGAIPHSFILPNMSPEKQDLTVKIYVSGRNAPCYLCNEDDHTADQCPSKPTPPPVESHATPVPATAVSRAALVPRATSVPPATASQQQHTTDTSENSSHHFTSRKWETILSESPETIKIRLIEAADEKPEIMASTGIRNLINGLISTQKIKDLDLEICLTPALGKMSPQFTTTIPKQIKHDTENNNTFEKEDKQSMVKLFIHLFASSSNGVNKKDILIMKDFINGNSSKELFLKWLCQWATFMTKKTKTTDKEVVITEMDTS